MGEALRYGGNGRLHGMAERSDGKRMPWYVIQVLTGHEGRMSSLIMATFAQQKRTAEAGGALHLEECFTPRFCGRKKWKDGWRDVEYPLLPGYVIAVTDTPAALAELLRGINGMCRLVSSGDAYTPLDDGERAWVEAQTNRGDRVVPMSFGYKEGDNLVVTSGPLKGFEGRIVRVDRRNCLAHLEFHVGEKTIKTSVGLAVVPKQA